MKLRNRHIVVIDDAESIRTFLRISLEAHGAEVAATATAAAGLARCEESKPDLIILDLGLPDQEGLKILPRLKHLGKQKNLPVIVLTVRNEPKYKQMAFELGADAYITKPFSVDDFIELLAQKLDDPTPPPVEAGGSQRTFQ